MPAQASDVLEHYSFEYSPYGLGVLYRHTFHAADRHAALQLCAQFVAASHGAEGQFVSLDDATGMVVVGAGHWQRRGMYALVRTLQDDQPIV